MAPLSNLSMYSEESVISRIIKVRARHRGGQHILPMMLSASHLHTVTLREKATASRGVHSAVWTLHCGQMVTADLS